MNAMQIENRRRAAKIAGGILAARGSDLIVGMRTDEIAPAKTAEHMAAAFDLIFDHVLAKMSGKEVPDR